MEKVVTLVRCESSLGKDAFRVQYLEQVSVLALSRCIASFVDVPPAEAGLDPATAPAPAYAAVLETWCDALDDQRKWLDRLRANSARLGARAFSYHVREVVQKEHARTWPACQRSPGIKGIYPVVRSPGMTAEEFARHWQDVHGPLALRHHVGLSKYVQNIVIRPITGDSIPDAPAFDGFSELHFPTARDMRERFIDSPEGSRIIAADVKSFVGEAIRLDTSEYVLEA